MNWACSGRGGGVLPGNSVFVCSPITNPPWAGMKRTIKLMSFCGPPAGPQGSQKP